MPWLARMTLLDALDDLALFAPAFPRPAWDAWRVFCRALYGLPMSAAEHATFAACTGRQTPPTTRARECWTIAGRRSGKSRIASAIATYTAALADVSTLAPGEVAAVLVCAASKRQAQIIFSYTRQLFMDVPALRPLVVGEQGSEDCKVLELRHGVRVEVRSANFRTVRGLTLLCAIIDEVAFLRSEDSANPDVELVRALRPGLATTGGLLLGLSSPWARRGVLWTKYRQHYAVDGSPVLVWQAPTSVMNPTLDTTVLAADAEDDPEAAASEYGGAFRADLESYVSMDVLDACTTPGVTVRPPGPATRDAVAFVDASGGSGRDSMTLAVAHPEWRGGAPAPVAVLDCVGEARPPFDPTVVTAEFTAVCTSYGIGRVVSDRYAGEWVRDAFSRCHVIVDQVAEPKSAIYLEALPLFASGRADLLDVPRLRLQLAGLERRRRAGGRDIVDHPPGGHDDLANAVAGALALAASPPTVQVMELPRLDASDPRAPSAAALEAAQLCQAFPDALGQPRDPDQRCGTCSFFDAATGVCTSEGPWHDHVVRPSTPRCDWFDPLPVGAEADAGGDATLRGLVRAAGRQ
jgi:hypothetical protein